MRHVAGGPLGPKAPRRLRRRFAQVGSGTRVCLRERMPQAAAPLPDAPGLRREAKQRVPMLASARTHAVAAACRHCGMARSTCSRWQRRDDPTHLACLEHRSPRPTRCRRPTGTAAQAAAVRQARDRDPRWGKDHLAVLRQREGRPRSVSLLGRILADLQRRGVRKAPLPTPLRPTRRQARPCAVRQPKEDPGEQPGDLVPPETRPRTPRPGGTDAGAPPSRSPPAPAWPGSVPAPPPAPPAASAPTCRSDDPSPAGRCRPRAGPRSGPRSRPPARSGGGRGSSSRHARPSATGTSNGPPAPPAASSGNAMMAISRGSRARRRCGRGSTRTITSGPTTPGTPAPPPSPSPRSARPNGRGRPERGQ